MCTACGAFQFTCSDGKCIPLWKVNDGKQDCANDEIDTAANKCGKGFVMCPNLNQTQIDTIRPGQPNSKYCIHPYSICDGVPDCQNSADEEKDFCLRFDCTLSGNRKRYIFKVKFGLIKVNICRASQGTFMGRICYY